MIAGGTIGRRCPDSNRTRRPICFTVDGSSDSHDAGCAVDGESPAVIVEQRVGNGIIGCVCVTGGCGDTHDRSDRSIFIDIIAGCVGVGYSPDIKLVDIVDSDRECLIAGGSIGRRCPDSDTA